MIIALDSIFENGISEIPLDHTFDFSSYDFNGAFPFTAPVHLSGAIKNTTGIVTLNAVATVVYDGRCDRCDCDVHRNFNVEINHILVCELNNEDNDEFILVEGMRLDVEQLTLEDIYLTLPTKILCKEDCEGICAQCGHNLNNGPCGCKKPIDPRFAALQQLLGEE